MRFQTKQRPHGLISRKHRIRLTLMVAAFGLVVVSSRIVGHADFWAQMFPDNQSSDTRDSDETVLNHTTLLPDRATDSVRVLRNDLRNSIVDNVIGVSSAESKAWFVSMGLAERLTAQQSRALPKARYALLMDAPDNCRGRAWTLTGTLRRLTKEKLTNDSTEYRNVVDAWLTLPDSGDGLVHVVALEAARGLPFAQEFDADPPEVTLSGYFFKREAYSSSASGGLSIAPMLLAASIKKVPLAVSAETRADQLTPWLGWLAITTCGALGLVVWSFVSSDAMNRSQRTHELTQLPSSPSFEGVEIETPHETLHHLETAAEAADELPYAGF